jgi:FkbM family methyltransferase
MFFIKVFRKILRNKFNRIDQKALSELLGDEGLSIVDLGAAGGIEPRWSKISNYLEYYGFEPDARTIQKKPKNKFKTYNVIPNLISNKSMDSALNISREEGKSSIYKPNLEFLSRFPSSSRFEIVDSLKLRTSTLDESINTEIDFIKLDIQGGELNALKGAEKLLGNVLGIETEVEFKDLYKSQPLFGDVDNFLSMNNFEFIDFTNLRRWERNRLGEYGQCVFGDALYLRTPENIFEDKISEIRFKKYLAILYLYNRFDLINRSLDLHTQFQSKLAIFEKIVQKKKSRFESISKVSNLANKIISFFGVEFRTHFIY